MNHPKILRNTAISGIVILLVFMLFRMLNDPDAPRSIDSISSTRSTLLFLFAVVLPGFLFGAAVSAGLPGLKKGPVNKVIFTVGCGLLYIGLVFPSITSATRALLFSGIGAAGCVLWAHLILDKVEKLPVVILLAFLAGVAAMLPMYLLLSGAEGTEGFKDQLPLLPLLVFPLWQILVGGLIGRGLSAGG